MAIRPDLIKYLEYIHNTGGNADIATFDEDWEPIGSMVRAEIMPKYVRENKEKKIDLTADGLDALHQSQHRR